MTMKRTKAGDIPKTSPERLAELAAMTDDQIDTSDIPNAATRRAMRDVKESKGLTRYADTDEMLAQIDTSDIPERDATAPQVVRDETGNLPKRLDRGIHS
jgi:hypothetical protein